MSEREPVHPLDAQPQGLSSVEAARRLAAEGPNALPGDGGRTWRHIVRDTVRDPMFSLLLGAAGLYLLLGDLQESLSLALMVLALLFIFLVLAAQFESFIVPFVIMPRRCCP